MNINDLDRDKVVFLGFLANTDSSVLKVSPQYGVSIETISIDDAFKLTSELSNFTDFGIFVDLTKDVWSNDKEMYVLVESFDAPSFREAVPKVQNNVVSPLLDNFLPKLRLFKEGNIQMPFYYLFDGKREKTSPRMRSAGRGIAASPKFHLDDDEIPNLQEFVKSITLPFPLAYVDLAFRSYDMSYGWMHPNLAFLMLMIGVETLLNPSKGEITYRVSRYAAVLLGDSQDESESIFKGLKALYRTRSIIVHGASKIIVEDQELTRLRGILRALIKEVNRIDKPKVELLDMLDSLGFGARPWRRET